MRISIIVQFLNNNKYGLNLDGFFNIDNQEREWFIKNDKGDKFFWSKRAYDNCIEENKFLLTNLKSRYNISNSVYNIKYIPFFYSVVDYHENREVLGLIDRAYLGNNDVGEENYDYLANIENELNIDIYDNVASFQTAEYKIFTRKYDVSSHIEKPYTTILLNDKFNFLRSAKYNILVANDRFEDNFTVNSKMFPMIDQHYLVCDKNDNIGVEYITELSNVFNIPIITKYTCFMLDIHRENLVENMENLYDKIFEVLVNE